MKSVTMLIIAALTAAIAHPAVAQTKTTFTFQGELQDNGSLAEGSYNLDFSLWDAANGGNQIGSTIVMNAVAVAGGRFTVDLDFGAGAFENSARWLEVAVSSQTLSPRHPITRTPYAMQVNGMTIGPDNNVLFDSLNAVEGMVTVSSPGGIDLILDADTNNAGEDQNARMVLRQDGGQVVSRIGYREGLNNLEIMQEYNAALTLGTNNVDRMWITGSGFIGMGRSYSIGSESFGVHAPVETGYGGMYISTDGEAGLPFYGYAAGGTGDMWHYYDGATGKWHVYNNGYRLTIEDNGDVGIGTTNPTAKLDVEGVAGVDGIRFPDETLQTTAAPRIISAQVWIDPPTVVAGGSIHQVVNVAGAAFGDAVVVNPGDTLAASVGIAHTRVSAPGQIVIQYFNAGAVDRNPSGTWWEIRLIK